MLREEFPKMLLPIPPENSLYMKKHEIFCGKLILHKVYTGFTIGFPMTFPISFPQNDFPQRFPQGVLKNFHKVFPKIAFLSENKGVSIRFQSKFCRNLARSCEILRNSPQDSDWKR